MRISAIVPAYNHAQYLNESIGSILAQTQPVDEIILVDDGSTDETRQVAASFGRRVKYIYQTNRGLSAARNTGVRAASCEWVALLDSDDWWKPHKIRLQREAALRRPTAALVYTATTTAFPDGSESVGKPVPPDALWPMLRVTNLIAPSSIMARRDALLDCGGFNEQLTACEDWDMWVRLRQRHSFANVPEAVTVYRYGESSMSNNVGRMLSNMERILEPTLLVNLDGPRRILWRRRIRAVQLFHAALMARSIGEAEERHYLTRSLAQWPSPCFWPTRYAAVARNTLGPRLYSDLRSRLQKLNFKKA